MLLATQSVAVWSAASVQRHQCRTRLLVTLRTLYEALPERLPAHAMKKKRRQKQHEEQTLPRFLPPLTSDLDDITLNQHRASLYPVGDKVCTVSYYYCPIIFMQKLAQNLSQPS